MSKIEDRLWTDLMREPGANLTLAIRQPSITRRSSRASLAACGALGLIAAIVAVLLLTTGTRTTPAYAVTVNGDGSVALTINELIGVSGANEQLAELGIPVVVAKIEAECVATGQVVEAPSANQNIVEVKKVGDGLAGLRWIIHPNEIPAGDSVQVTTRYANDGRPGSVGVAGSWAVFRGDAPDCRRPESSGP